MAEIARTGFCRPVAVKSADAQGDRIALKARQHLVGQRRDAENTIRGLLASLGHRFPKGVGKFAGRVQAILEEYPELGAAIEPLLGAGAALAACLERLDKEVGRRAKDNPACRLLMTAPGVGPVTAPAFASTIDDPGRFAKSRAVGAYVGLTTRRFQSGEMDYSGRLRRRIRRWPSAILDRPCARWPCEPRPARRNGLFSPPKGIDKEGLGPTTDSHRNLHFGDNRDPGETGQYQ